MSEGVTLIFSTYFSKQTSMISLVTSYFLESFTLIIGLFLMKQVR